MLYSRPDASFSIMCHKLEGGKCTHIPAPATFVIEMTGGADVQAAFNQNTVRAQLYQWASDAILNKHGSPETHNNRVVGPMEDLLSRPSALGQIWALFDRRGRRLRAIMTLADKMVILDGKELVQLQSLIVAPQHQKHGIGKIFAQHVFQQHNAQNVGKGLVLGALHASAGFWKRLGWTEIPFEQLTDRAKQMRHISSHMIRLY